jgi:hypothetical protein
MTEMAGYVIVDVVGYVIGADTDFGVHCSPSTQLW